MHVNLPRTRTEAADRPAHSAKPSTAEKASAGNFGDLLKSAKDAAASGGATPPASAAPAPTATALPSLPL
ncbi:hypothetical protein ACFJGW_14275 [Burkholderiaceae bacterium UC74_6]